MTKSNSKRNARRSQRDQGFKIGKNPMVRLAHREPSVDEEGRTALNHAPDKPSLFAIARDARTIFASWTVNWRSIFERTVPADRQVYLRVVGRDGVMETKITVEPMYAVSYVTTSGLQKHYHVEIGYFQPLDTWHSVATSNEVNMPPAGEVELADVDLATIPFHVSFQKLADLFGITNDLSRAASQFQKRILNGDKPNETTASDKKILDALNLSLSEMGGSARNYKNIDNEKLARQMRAKFRLAATSPLRGFQPNAGS